MSGITGFSTQKKLNGTIGSFANEETSDKSQFATLQNNYSDKVGLDAVQTGVWKVNLGLLTIASVSNINSVRVLNITGHGAKKGDMIRFTDDSSLQGFEVRVQKVIDADSVVISGELPEVPTPGDEVDVLRAVTIRLGADGTIQVSVAPTPIRFVQDGVDTEVEVSTTAPEDSKPLPVQELSRIVGSDLIDCSVTPINNASPVALLTTVAYVQSLEVVNSTGIPMILSIGGEEIVVGGDGLKRQAIAIPLGTDLEIKTAQLTAVADSGIVGINLFA